MKESRTSTPGGAPVSSFPTGAMWRNLPWGYLQSAFECYVPFEPGIDLVRPGEECRHVYRVVDGWCMRYKRLSDGRRHIYDLRLPGDLVNLPAKLPHRCEYGARSITRGRVARFGADAVLAIVADEKSAKSPYTADVECQKRALDRSLLRCGRLSSVERMADLLVDLGERLSPTGFAENQRYYFPVEPEILGDMLGLSRFQVEGVLRRLGGMELAAVDWARQQMVIQDVDGLRRLAHIDSGSLAPPV